MPAGLAHWVVGPEEPALKFGISYVVVSSAWEMQYRRYLEQDPSKRVLRQRFEFYEALRRRFDFMKSFASSDTYTGPEVRIYRLR